jgi:hypothetical protein
LDNRCSFSLSTALSMMQVGTGIGIKELSG